MAGKESYRNRQNNEFEVIQSIFGSDVEDLRPHTDAWKPLDLRISLFPPKDYCGEQTAYVSTKLHIVCSAKYPKVVPKISLVDTKNISDALIVLLLQDLQKQAESLKGEVMIYELTQTIQAFLHEHNKPPAGSFYEEMLQQKQKREQELLNRKLMKEKEERKNLLDEVQKRKEILKNESKRRETRRSMSESNTHHKFKDTSSSENSENASPFYRDHFYPNKCMEHRSSENMYFTKSGRKIVKGGCLGHSQKGCVAFSGIDTATGQLLYLTEWNIKYSQIEAKCTGHCYWFNEPKCNGHKTDDLISAIEKQVNYLSQLHHKNLIQYECVLCIKKREGVVVYLVQDFVLGTSVFSISSSLGWCAEGASMVAKGVLEALIYLHNKGVSHSQLLDSTVFMDNSGTIRCTDFSLVPNLHELIGGQRSGRGDLPALGALIESLMPTLHSEMKDFVEKCKSDRTLSASDLLEHSFLRPSLFSESAKKDTLALPKSNVERSIAPFQMPAPLTTLTHSRIATEFEVLLWLGKGAFGDVLKVRNKLDNRQYAIKRIPLSARSQKLYRKMTREVELLSRLNHENVVRYFNSWIENATASDLEEIDKKCGSEWSMSHESRNPTSQVPCAITAQSSSSSSWQNFIPRGTDLDDSDDSMIQFVDSQGDEIVYPEEEEENSSDEPVRKTASPRPIQVMYIQMEFCEKCTLRTAIDENLYENTERLWRLFREILEGLTHIHQQGMIHRDLKPVNIFLDSRDQIKIGDFGLATTSFLALQSQEQVPTHSAAIEVGTGTGTGTGKVGTTLYVAPELTGNASKSTYNQKVDMYTLGIILFEMSSPPFDTGMERVKTIAALRDPGINFPEKMLNDSKQNKTREIIRWLLNHDPSQRPTAEELLSSDLVPPAPLEFSELQEMLRHALANPQSKAYKHLIARCLAQESDTVLELTYHYGLVPISHVLEFVKDKVVRVFKKHGAIEVSTPLLTPFSRNTYISTSPVKLMTHSGSVVILPNDLRAPFARHMAMSGINMIRRYSIDRTYREKKVFNFHPKQLCECGFDVITPNPGSNIVDAELLSIAYEIICEIPMLKQKNICIRINHTTLLRAILQYCNVPPKKYGELFGNVLDYIEGRLSRFQLHSAINSIIGSSKTSASAVADLLLSEFTVSGMRGSNLSPGLKYFTRGKGSLASLAKGAIREIESIVSLAQNLGVTCPFNVYPGLPIGFERASTGGVVWQMLGNIKLNSGPSVIAVGERYDAMLSDFQKQAQTAGVSIPYKEISGAGFSISLDKLATAFSLSGEIESKGIDVVVCVSGSRPNVKEIATILRMLWSANIRSGVVEANNLDEAQDLAKELGASHVVLLGEAGSLRLRSWDRERFQERVLSINEIVEYVQKLITPDTLGPENSPVAIASSSSFSGFSLRSTSFTNSVTFSNVQIRICTPEKQSANIRRRYESQVTHQMTTTLLQFNKDQIINIIVVDLPCAVLNAIVAAINPRETENKETDKELNYVIERFPKYKRYISDIVDEILNAVSMKSNAPGVVALCTITNYYYRVIL